MHYTSTTPTMPDLDHVIAVLGLERFSAYVGPAMQGVPVSEWGLTDREIARIAAGPHGQIGVYLLDNDYYGFAVQEWTVECECGATFSDRLLSNAMRGHDDHAGHHVSHIHTADLLDS